MSILIKGVEMPTSCDMCWALDDYGDYPRCRITQEQRGYNFPVREQRMDRCPLVPVPPHGRLIDADAFLALINDSMILSDFLKCIINPLIRGEPTVIEAEEGE